MLEHSDTVAALGAERVFAVDAAASFSRPGPRLVEGTELLAHLLHPDRVDAPAGVAFQEVAYQPPSARRSYLTSLSPSSKTSSFDSVNRSRNHSESSRPTPLWPAPPKGASWSQ